MGERGQVTIFVIIALVIVGFAVVYFLILSVQNQSQSPLGGGNGFSEISVEQNLRGELAPKVFQYTQEILAKGGYVAQTNVSLVTRRENQTIAFLCYTSASYFPCKNVEPLLFQRIQQELSLALQPHVVQAVTNLETAFESQGFTTETNYHNFSITLAPRQIRITLFAEIIGTRKDEAIRVVNPTIVFPTALYDLAGLAQEISSQEAEFCSFSTQGYSLLYPQFDVRVLKRGDGVEIYDLAYLPTKEKMQFAVRSCVINPLV